METRIVKETKQLTYEKVAYVAYDFYGNEVELDNEDAAHALEGAVSKAKIAHNYICKSTELKYITPKGIKKGDIVKVVTYWPEQKKTTTTESIGVYDGIEIERFDSVDGSPAYQILLSNKWSPGLHATAREYPYQWIPQVLSKSSCSFRPINDNVHCYEEILLITEEEKKKYAEAILENAKYS